MTARSVLAGTFLVTLLTTAAAAQGPAGAGTAPALPPPRTDVAVAPPCGLADDGALPLLGIVLRCWRELGLSSVAWYYCPVAGAYYPYVRTCPEPWVPVVPRD
jgi:hypothetical protein